MSQSETIEQLNQALQTLWAGLGLTALYVERAERVAPHDDHVHFTFTYGEEDQVDKLIRAARRTLASFGPEYWLSDSHQGAAQFQHSEHIHFRIRKSLIVSHMYWGVSFFLCAPNEGYSLVEDTQP